jgi:predicted PurR-regulated permease PerM
VVVVAVVLAGFALYFGRVFFVPVVLSIMFDALLRPQVRWLERHKVPTPLGASLVVLTWLALLVGAGRMVSQPVKDWVARAPETIREAQLKVRSIMLPIDRLTQAATGADSSAQRSTAASPRPAIVTAVVGKGTAFIVGFVEVLLMTWLLLGTGDLLARKIEVLARTPKGRRTAMDVLHASQSIAARYIIFTVLIALGEAIIVGLVMWALGMPDPLIWALLTAAAELVPYLGGLILVVLLTITALTTFDSVAYALLIPSAYLVISALQNNLVTPWVFGARLRLNPVILLVGVLLWWFLWGIPGAFLAIPMIAMFKAFCDETPRLARVGEFLGA